MPTRLIKESICLSDTINQLSWFEEVLFLRLLTVCDDYGRMDARPQILKGRMFPLKEDLRADQIRKGLQSLQDAGLVSLYEAQGKPYLQVVTWEKHQAIRTKKSKYPDPHTSENRCMQMQTDSGKCDRHPNPNPNPNPDPKPTPQESAPACEGPDAAAAARWRENMAVKARIVDACRAWGLPTDPGNVDRGLQLAREYTEPWLLDAIRIAGEGPAKSWKYVEGVLRRARETGSMQLPRRQDGGKRVAAQQYGQREYDDADLTERLGLDALFREG